MQQPASHSTRSRAAIAGHPLHPVVLPFPFVFLTSTLVSDALLLFTGDGFWARASLYGLLAGLVTGVLAAILGLIDFSSIRAARSHRVGWLHGVGNLVVLLLAAINLVTRWGQPEAITPLPLVLSLLSTLLLGVTGWAGGELAYRHKIGVDDAA